MDRKTSPKDGTNGPKVRHYSRDDNGDSHVINSYFMFSGGMRVVVISRDERIICASSFNPLLIMATDLSIRQ